MLIFRKVIKRQLMAERYTVRNEVSETNMNLSWTYWSVDIRWKEDDIIGLKHEPSL